MMVVKRASEKMAVSITTEDDEPKPWTGLDLAGKGLCAFGTGVFTMPYITHLYLSNNDIDRLPSAIERLTNLQVLDMAHNKLRQVPAEMHKLSELRELSLNNNHLSSLPYELGRLYQLDYLDIRGNPLVEPFNLYVTDTDKLLSYLLDNAPITQAPPPRQWIYPVAFDADDDNKSNGSSVTAFCYNVLCEKYATRQVYRYCPSWALEWDYRKQNINKEILKHSSDIICLQEVAGQAYHSFFSQEMSRAGYSGRYRPKSRARTMSEKDRETVDGCAIFFHNTKYKMLKEFLIELQPTCSKYAYGCAAMLNRVMPKDNIALCVLLESVVTQQPLFVCNLHLTWDPKFKDVKVVQLLLILKEIEAFLKQEHSTDIPMLIMGDFNSEHDSGVYELLSKGKLSRSHPDLAGFDYTSLFDNVGLDHNLNLSSAYTEEIPYSNYTPTFIGIIDYIWYSAEYLNPAALLGPVDEEYINEHVDGCPNAHFASDHMALSTQFNFYD
eukprot:m.61400 g.61400  ORF g.61400 m.61400 type:complete len:496 (-) comp13875_c0_seq1:83-1570(-)